jgi:1-deoxy-D-xylulose 5-phosphate reductoisomerase
MPLVSPRRDVVILGSTGSVGTQALEVIRANPDRFRVVGLTAGGSQRDLFRAQADEFRPRFADLGEDASVEAATLECDVVLNGITGPVGLRPTLAAPAVYNAANELCVAAFLAGEMRFTDIVPTIADVLSAHDVRSEQTELTVADVLAADAWARAQATQADP